MSRTEQDRLNSLLRLGVSLDEAKQVLKDDKIIDGSGRCDWEPSIEEEKAMRKETKLKVPRAKKEPDEEKVNIIAALAAYLEDNYNNVMVIQEGKSVDFVIGENVYGLSLTKHRKS